MASIWSRPNWVNALPDVSVVCIPRRIDDDTIPITVLRNNVLVRLDSAVKLSSFPQLMIQPPGKYVNKLISPWTKWTQFGTRQFPNPFFNENDRIAIWISLKFVPRSPIDDKPALVQVMAWRRREDKPLPEPMMT